MNSLLIHVFLEGAERTIIAMHGCAYILIHYWKDIHIHIQVSHWWHTPMGVETYVMTGFENITSVRFRFCVLSTSYIR